MSTNYMTVIESEMDKLNVRLWRIKQAMKYDKKTLGCPKLDAAIMEYRYKVTKHLLDVLFMQHCVWECAEEEDYRKWNENPPKPEELVKEFDFPVDEELAKGQYRDHLEDFEGIEIDSEYMDIYNPTNWWKDLPHKKRKELVDEAKKALEEMRLKIKEK